MIEGVCLIFREEMWRERLVSSKELREVFRLLSAEAYRVVGEAWLTRFAIFLSPLDLFVCHGFEIINRASPRSAIKRQTGPLAGPEPMVCD